MRDEDPQPVGLANSHCPAAIVHEGFFVYANPAFLDRLGYRALDDLQAVPLLDLVDDRDHARLREHLDAAKRAAGTDRHPPGARLTLRRADDLPLVADLTSFRTRFAGEDCLQLNLQTRVDRTLRGRIGALPWRHYLSVLFLILFTILPSSLLLRLNINNTPYVYFPDDEPAVVLDRELRERFPNDQVIVLMFEGVALFSDGFLEAYDGLAQRLRRLPEVQKVVGVTTQDHIAGSEDEFIVEPLIDVRRLDESRPQARRQRIADDRLSQGALMAADGSALALVVIPNEIANSLERLAVEEAVRSEVTAARLGGYLSAVAGQIPVDVAQLRSMLRDNMIFIPATVTVGLLLIWWLFRRWIAVMLAGVAIGVVVNSTVAIYVLLDQPFTLISSIIPPLLSALTVAALVHLFNAVFLASRRGQGGPGRVARALREVERPARFAALTTAAGLASLATSPIVPIKAFGLISAAGTGLIYLVVYHVLPNLLARWDRRPWPRTEGGAALVDGLVGVLYRTGMRHPAWVTGGILAAIALGAPQIGKVTVETNLQAFFHPGHEIRQQTAHVDEKLVGTMPVSVIFDATERGGLQQPAALGLMRDFERWAEDQPEIDRAFGLADFVEEMHWAFNAEQPAFRAIPADAQVIAQYLLIYDGDDIYDFVDRDFQHSQVTLNLNVHSANEIEAVLDRVRAYLQDHVGDQLRWEIAGVGRLFADMEELLVAGQTYSLLGALLLIYLCMLFLFRSPAAAALCMIPNLSPILLIFIIMGIAGIWLDMATAMIASVAIGIAVDDTIHVYHGFRTRLAQGTGPVLALARSYREAGRAVVVTTIILGAQFLVLVWSDFVPTRNFGLLTTVGLLTALLFDLLLLPALLMIFYGANSPVARWIARRRGPAPPAAAAGKGAEAEEASAAYDAAYWTAERKVTLVREILSGRLSVAAAAREFGLPETTLERWVGIAEKGIADALAYRPPRSIRDPAKVRALAEAYKRLKAENRELKARGQD